MSEIGYKKDLLVLPFDHRGSFQSGLFGIKDREPTPQETKEIASYKDVVYDGFKAALQSGVPRDRSAVLCDEQFGDAVLQDARRNGIAFAMPVEKSGQDEFDFEYGPEFAAHIEKYQPTLVKCLVRWNPESDAALNQRQGARLKMLSEYCRKRGAKLMFELLVPSTKAQLEKAGGDKGKYDAEQRPRLMAQAIEQIQKAGVEPDVWKLEGVEKPQDAAMVSTAARTGAGRGAVGIIVLGRGENKDKVREWLKVGARIEGVIGFAVGRTVFWDALKGLKDGKHDRAAAVKQIAENYKGFVDLWLEHRK
jgi:5-dehydro-2-deoxygluconokinase